MTYVNVNYKNLNISASLKRIFSFFMIVIVMITWCAPSFAIRQPVVASGTVNAAGQTDGVDMTGGVGTLTVGVGFPNIGAIGGPSVSTDVNNSDSILFNDLVTSTVSGDLGTNLLSFFNVTAAGNATTNFQGTVFATTMNVGTGTVNFNSGTITNRGAVTFTGDGTVSLAANTQNIGALITGTDNTGTLSLASGSTWLGAVGGGAFDLKAINVVGGSNIAGVTATIDGAVEAYSFSLGTNTLNITGALAIDNPGPSSINTTLASATVFGRIVPVGAVTLPATLGVNVLVPATSSIPVGTQFNIVQATSGTSGSVVAVTVQNPTNPLYTFAPVPLASTLNGIVTVRVTGIPLTTATTPAAAVLATIPNSDIFAPINALSDPIVVANAVAQLDPTNNGVTTQVAFNTTNEAMGALTTHLGEAGNNPSPGRSGISTGDFWKNNGIWIKGFGESATQDTHKGVSGYDSTTGGIIGGVDGILTREVLLGIAGGYAATNVDNEGTTGGTNIDSYIGTVYVSFDDPSPWYGDMGFMFTWNSYDTTRNIVFPGVNRTATSSPDGQTYTGFWDVGYVVPINPDWNITPIAGLTYSHTEISKYTETGAGDVNLNVNSQNYDQLLSALGVRIDGTLKDDASGKWVPEVHARWLYDFIGDAVATTSTFTGGGASFNTNGLDPEKSTYNVGTGLTFYSKGNVSVTGTYDYKFANDFSSHTGLATVRWTF